MNLIVVFIDFDKGLCDCSCWCHHVLQGLQCHQCHFQCRWLWTVYKAFGCHNPQVIYLKKMFICSAQPLNFVSDFITEMSLVQKTLEIYCLKEKGLQVWCSQHLMRPQILGESRWRELKCKSNNHRSCLVHTKLIPISVCSKKLRAVGFYKAKRKPFAFKCLWDNKHYIYLDYPREHILHNIL